jgi:hypothetical protein
MRKYSFLSLTLVFCFTTNAAAWPPWARRRVLSNLPNSGYCLPFNRDTNHCVSDYVAISEQPVLIPAIGISVRDGQIHIDGSTVSGAEVIDVVQDGPAARAGIRAGGSLVKDAILEAGAVFAVVVTPLIPIFEAIDRSSVLDHSDVIIAIDGERIRNSLDLHMRAANPIIWRANLSYGHPARSAPAIMSNMCTEVGPSTLGETLGFRLVPS